MTPHDDGVCREEAEGFFGPMKNIGPQNDSGRAEGRREKRKDKAGTDAGATGRLVSRNINT